MKDKCHDERFLVDYHGSLLISFVGKAAVLQRTDHITQFDVEAN